jgi:eukaryotic-like serine/threonine-protein kinase
MPGRASTREPFQHIVFRLATASGATSSAEGTVASGSRTEHADGQAFRRVDRFVVGARLGSGGTATVYLARALDAPTDAPPLALKVVHDHLIEESEFLDQFADEAALLVRLTHPNIVQVRDQGRDGAAPFLLMEYLDGQPLSRFIGALARRKERMAPELVAWIGARVAHGLAYAHTATDTEGQPLGLIHRDVSPQNVFLTYAGDVKIIDFGIARARGRLSRTTHGKVKGKFSYMAPEQLLTSSFDHRADLFALGATLYEAAVGQRLFAALEESEALHRLLFEEIADPRQLVPTLPAELARIIMWALAREPDARPASAGALAEALDTFLATSSLAKPRPALSQLARQLFQKEREQREREIAELARSSRESIATLRPTNGSVPQRGARARGRQLVFAAAIAIGAAGLIGGALYATSGSPPPASSPAAVPEEVQLEVSLTPPVAASIAIAGTKLQGPTASIRLLRSDQPVPLEISIDGYETVRRAVIPDRDRALAVELAPVRMVEAPIAAPTASAPAAAGPRTRNPAKKNDQPARSKDSLVTDYPY